MTKIRFPVYIGNGAIAELLTFLQQQGFRKLALVCDDNTFPALGQRVADALQAQRVDVNVIQLQGKNGDSLVADEVALIDVLTRTRRDEQVFLAVGGGTITDITRFCSYTSRVGFISLPTAPSVDGFTSLGAPLVIGGLKKTLICQAPLAVFADLPTLCAAPQRLLAAGFGDMIGKINSATDWQIGHLLHDEEYDDGITHRYFATALNCAEYAEGIGQREPEAVKVLMESLIESGFGMLDFGNSNPASGAEHHLSHLWEMMLLMTGRHALLHGAKVGTASVITAGWFQQLARLSGEDMAERMAHAHLPDKAAEEQRIRQVFGSTAEQLIAEQKYFLEMTPAQYESLKQRVLNQWDELRIVLMQVPAPEQIAQWLQAAGGPVRPEQLGLTSEDISQAIHNAFYLRNRFTVARFIQLFQLI